MYKVLEDECNIALNTVVRLKETILNVDEEKEFSEHTYYEVCFLYHKVKDCIKEIEALSESGNTELNYLLKHLDDADDFLSHAKQSMKSKTVPTNPTVEDLRVHENLATSPNSVRDKSNYLRYKIGVTSVIGTRNNTKLSNFIVWTEFMIQSFVLIVITLILLSNGVPRFTTDVTNHTSFLGSIARYSNKTIAVLIVLLLVFAMLEIIVSIVDKLFILLYFDYEDFRTWLSRSRFKNSDLLNSLLPLTSYIYGSQVLVSEECSQRLWIPKATFGKELLNQLKEYQYLSKKDTLAIDGMYEDIQKNPIELLNLVAKLEAVSESYNRKGKEALEDIELEKLLAESYNKYPSRNTY